MVIGVGEGAVKERVDITPLDKGGGVGGGVVIQAGAIQIHSVNGSDPSALSTLADRVGDAVMKKVHDQLGGVVAYG